MKCPRGTAWMLFDRMPLREVLRYRVSTAENAREPMSMAVADHTAVAVSGELKPQPGSGVVSGIGAGQPEAPGGGDQKAASGAAEADLLWKLRKYLMLLAILAAAITYQAGLAPPGGFWQDNSNGHVASDVVLQVSYPRRYKVFFYCNTTAFVASLIVLILLLIRGLSRSAVWLRSLQTAMLLGLLGLMGAYAAGSCREVRTSIYIWVLLFGIFAYVTLHVVFFRHFAPQGLKKWLMGRRKLWKEALRDILHRSDNSNEQEVHDQTDKMEELERNRSFLLVLATLVATVTYIAGLSPPGGFWPDSQAGHLAGDPVLRDHYPRRFKVFLSCNATAFAGSLVIIIMLLTDTAVDHVVKSNALRLCVLGSLFGLMGAYAAGTCRQVSTSIYVFDLVGVVLLYLVLQWVAHIMPITKCVEAEIKKLFRCLKSCLPKEDSRPPAVEGISSDATSAAASTTSEQCPPNDMEKLRTYLLLLGILAATVTYQAGLNPPGGFWTDNGNGHLAGDPILKVTHPKRYKAFFYCNATSFVASLVIIIMLQSKRISIGAMKCQVLQTAMTLDLFGLMGAYAAGSSRKTSTSVYVFVLALLVFIYVMLHILLFLVLKSSRLTRGLEKLKTGMLEWYVTLPDSFKNVFRGSTATPDELGDLDKRRKFLMLLAILAASITYQAGISPPGGFWTDDNEGHRAGDPMFRDEFPRRYNAFFYLNATAFMASLAVILLLVSKSLCRKGLECYALRVCVLIDLISLMGAFAAGSCRKVSASVYVFVVVIVVLAYVVIQVLVLTFAEDKLKDLLERYKIGTSASLDSGNHTKSIKNGKRSEHKWRKDLMLIGTLAVTVTYQAGLLPPGGLWPDDRDGHFAGDPILHDNYPKRYKVFFYCNATAFMASVLMVTLLLNNTISKYKRSLRAMKAAMVLDLIGLLGAFAAGSCRKVKTSAYIFALVIAVFIYIVVHVLLSFDEAARFVRSTGERSLPCLKKMWALIDTEPSDHQQPAKEPQQLGQSQCSVADDLKVPVHL